MSSVILHRQELLRCDFSVSSFEVSRFMWIIYKSYLHSYLSSYPTFSSTSYFFPRDISPKFWSHPNLGFPHDHFRGRIEILLMGLYDKSFLKCTSWILYISYYQHRIIGLIFPDNNFVCHFTFPTFSASSTYPC
jgi:hypothetical protein